MPRPIRLPPKRFDRLMEAGLLAPAAWRRLCSRPLALFGSVFSHVDVEHISGNLAALRACRTAEAWLGSPARRAPRRPCTRHSGASSRRRSDFIVFFHYDAELDAAIRLVIAPVVQARKRALTAEAE